MTDTTATALPKDPVTKPTARAAAKKPVEAEAAPAVAAPPEPIEAPQPLAQEGGVSSMPTQIAQAEKLTEEAAETVTRLSSELTDLAKGRVEAVVASASAFSRAAADLGDELIEYGRANFEQVSASCRQLADVRSPADLFRVQSDYAKASLDLLMSESSRLQGKFGELLNEVTQSFSDATRLPRQ